MQSNSRVEGVGESLILAAGAVEKFQGMHISLVSLFSFRPLTG
jgi:hypothetical protein